MNNKIQYALLAGVFALAGSMTAYAGEPNKTAGLTEDEKEFLTEAAEDNLEMQAMIKMGGLKGSHTKVKEFSKEITPLHTSMADQLKGLATKKGINLPATLEKDDRLKLDVMEKLSGLTFDKRFMKEMVDENTDLIENFDEALRECNDAELKSFAEKTVPQLRDHLAKAKVVLSTLEGNASN
jgi:putative membrane protein